MSREPARTPGPTEARAALAFFAAGAVTWAGVLALELYPPLLERGGAPLDGALLASELSWPGVLALAAAPPLAALAPLAAWAHAARRGRRFTSPWPGAAAWLGLMALLLARAAWRAPEAEGVAALRALHAAQERFLVEDPDGDRERDYGTLAELRAVRLVDPAAAPLLDAGARGVSLALSRTGRGWIAVVAPAPARGEVEWVAATHEGRLVHALSAIPCDASCRLPPEARPLREPLPVPFWLRAGWRAGPGRLVPASAVPTLLAASGVALLVLVPALALACVRRCLRRTGGTQRRDRIDGTSG